ncbi:MAG: PGPGW domain-containing protein [Gammaproteobacteria bacterium]
MNSPYKNARKVVIGVVGITIVIIGLALLVLPGPGILMVAAGLALLALEFAWARVWLAKVRRGISDVAQRQRSRNRGRG